MVVVVRRAAREKTSALGGSSDSAVVMVAVRKGHFGCFEKYVFIDHGGGIDVVMKMGSKVWLVKRNDGSFISCTQALNTSLFTMP